MKSIFFILPLILFLTSCNDSKSSKALDKSLNDAIEEFSIPNEQYKGITGKDYTQVLKCKHKYQDGYRLILVSMDDKSLRSLKNQTSIRSTELYFADVQIFEDGYASKNVGFYEASASEGKRNVFYFNISTGPSPKENTIIDVYDSIIHYIDHKNDASESFDITCWK